eukprot:1138193-Pelagomonas_calceolata.AAC.1
MAGSRPATSVAYADGCEHRQYLGCRSLDETHACGSWPATQAVIKKTNSWIWDKSTVLLQVNELVGTCTWLLTGVPALLWHRTPPCDLLTACRLVSGVACGHMHVHRQMDDLLSAYTHLHLLTDTCMFTQTVTHLSVYY